MVITIDSGTWALIYELALIPTIFGLDWVRIFRQLYGLDWIGLGKIDPCPTLVQRCAE